MSTTDEQETLQEIHKELKDYDEDVRELEEIKNQVDRFDLKQSKGARLLLKILIAKERRIQNQMKKTIKTDDANLQEDHEEKIITIQDLIEAVTRRQETPNQEKVDQIAQVNFILVHIFFKHYYDYLCVHCTLYPIVAYDLPANSKVSPETI